MAQKLSPLLKNPASAQKPKVLIVVLDGIGALEDSSRLTETVAQGLPVTVSPFQKGNAVHAAYTPNLQKLLQGPLARTLKAHGPAVGLPSWDDMGNSEVGHNALGAGRIFDQGAKRVADALSSKSLFQEPGWAHVARRPRLKSGESVLHFVGLLSDGNVHSHIDHLLALIAQAKAEGVRKVCIHALLDGRDVPPTSALCYVDRLESFLQEVNSSTFSATVASGGGRMNITMDRYNADWSMVERGYLAHVCGQAPHQFATLKEAVLGLRQKGFGSDQDLPAFVLVHDDGTPRGMIHSGDSVVLFNFRGDRAIEFSRALTEQNFTAFHRPWFPDVNFAGMMQYDGDLKIPEFFLVSPPVITQSMTELLSASGVPQFACSETQKYGHVTYFWNGNRSEKFNPHLEKDLEIPSDKGDFDNRPWMKCAEICDAAIDAMTRQDFQVGRINFANGDMVGHTGNMAAAIIGVSAVDLCLGRLMAAAQKTQTILVVTADHGNADEMYEKDKKSGNIALDSNKQPKLKTSHTLAPVPFALFNAQSVLGTPIGLRTDLPQAGLAHVAATVLELAGFEPPAFYEPSLLLWDEAPDTEKKKHLNP